MALALLILFYTWLLGFVIALGGTILQLREENLPGVPWARVLGATVAWPIMAGWLYFVERR